MVLQLEAVVVTQCIVDFPVKKDKEFQGNQAKNVCLIFFKLF